jgi:hypothetical protein
MSPGTARWLFRGAAIYGLIVLLPLYLLEHQVAAPAAALAHPEYYYGFIGAAAAWQLVYWTIGGDPVRYRAFMPLGVIAKFGFWIPTFLLWLNGRTPTSTFAVTNVDLLLGIGFFVAWRRLKAPA